MEGERVAFPAVERSKSHRHSLLKVLSNDITGECKEAAVDKLAVDKHHLEHYFSEWHSSEHCVFECVKPCDSHSF